MTSDIYCNDAVLSGTTTAVLSSAELWERPSAVFHVMEVMADFRDKIVLRDFGIMEVLGEVLSMRVLG